MLTCWGEYQYVRVFKWRAEQLTLPEPLHWVNSGSFVMEEGAWLNLETFH